MVRSSWISALTCIAASLGGMAALGQDPRDQDRPRDGARPRDEMRRDVQSRTRDVLKAKQIMGSRVSLRGDTAVGTVEDIVLTPEGSVDYLVVINEGKYVMVPWEAAKFNFEQRTAVINITQDRFREVPTFTTDRWPDVYDPTYRQQIYTYYGLTPGTERRIERRERRR